VTAVLSAWGFPGQKDVVFDLSTYDLIIDGKELQVAYGLRRIAAICNVLQTCSSKSLNTFIYFDRVKRLLICGLLVRFQRGSPAFARPAGEAPAGEPSSQSTAEAVRRSRRAQRDA
jgi:hypothetical protein